MAFDMLAAMGKRAASAAPAIVMIDIDNIEPNQRNFYRVQEDVDIEKQNEQTKASIEMYGVKQPIIVKPIENGRYKIMTGERRHLICRRLVEEGNDKFRMMPCIIETPQSEEDERIELIITNQYREKSLAEKIEEVRQLAELIEKKKARGDKVSGRMNEAIAGKLNMSKSEVGRLRQIDKNLQPELKEALKENKMAMTTAVELAKLPPQDQKAVYEQTGGEIKAKEARQMKKKEPQSMNIDGFEPTPPEQKKQPPADIENRIFAVTATVAMLEEKKAEALELMQTDKENSNAGGVANRKAQVQYLEQLRGRAENDLFELQGQRMF